MPISSNVLLIDSNRKSRCSLGLLVILVSHVFRIFKRGALGHGRSADADVQRIKCLLKDESGEDVVISKVPVRVRLESFVGLIDPSAVCETNYEGGIELYVVSDVHAVKERHGDNEVRHTFACFFSFSIMIATESLIRITT